VSSSSTSVLSGHEGRKPYVWRESGMDGSSVGSNLAVVSGVSGSKGLLLYWASREVVIHVWWFMDWSSGGKESKMEVAM